MDIGYRIYFTRDNFVDHTKDKRTELELTTLEYIKIMYPSRVSDYFLECVTHIKYPQPT